jgi:hypothetical protein
MRKRLIKEGLLGAALKKLLDWLLDDWEGDVTPWGNIKPTDGQIKTLRQFRKSGEKTPPANVLKILKKFKNPNKRAKKPNPKPKEDAMNESYLKYVIREEIEKLSEQGQPIMPRQGWKNKMIQVYNKFGCTGLQNRKQIFINNQAGLVPGYNERWRAMLQVKIDFMEYLQNRYNCQ